MRAIVTGGAGFIGSHVVDAARRARRRGRRPRRPLAAGSARTSTRRRAGRRRHPRPEAVGEVFGEATPEACLHLAAQADVRVSIARPDFDAEVNVLGTIRLLEAAREHGTRIVFASTGGAIYGECDEPATESAPREPLSQYGTSKLAGEEYLATYNRLYGSEHTALPLRQRLRAAPGSSRRGGRRRHLPRAAGRAARRRTSSATARSSATTSTWATSRPSTARRARAARPASTTSAPAWPRRCSTSSRPAAAPRASRSSPSSTRRGSASCSAASSTRAWPSRFATGPVGRAR